MYLSDEVGLSIEIGVELFKDLIFQSYAAVTAQAKDKSRAYDLFGTATRQYVGGLIKRYNMVQVLGMREPVPLESLFVRANILEKISSSTRLLPEDLNKFFDFDRRSFGKKQQTVDGELIVNKLQKFIVLGKPGAGKTTYLKYLTLMMLNKYSQIEHRKLPVFVTLREWADQPMPLMDFLVQQFDICGFQHAQAFVERMLRDGQCLVLFDGLDEVGELAKQDDIIRQIRDFSDKYYDNQFIISCRVAAYNHEFAGFTEVEMADFNEAQIETFISNWFHGDPKTAAECWARLKSNASLRELASTPLLLTLLCMEYDESNDFPPNRSALYHRGIETLLTKWDSTRRIRRQEMYKNLTLRQKESMFARIAAGTFVENQYFMQERDLVRMIEKFVEHLPAFKAEELEVDSKAVLKAIEAHHGIFVERANEVYSFAHLTFQEYFTAKYIVDNAREGTLENLVDQHLDDPKWKEVFLLTAGLLDSADELLLLMQRKSREALEIPEINNLFEVSVASLLPVKNRYSTVVRQNIAVFLALDRTRVLHLARTLDLVVDLARALNHDLSIVGLVDTPLYFTRTRALDFDFLKSFGEANNLNLQIIEKIKYHFTANVLIVNCLSSANFVSKPVREKILNEMFQPKQ